MGMYQEALAIRDIITANRRHLHQNPETGMELPKTAAFVEEKLKEMGYAPRRIGSCGIVAEIGKEGGKCILLRADMDALPVREETERDFRSENGSMHACGHDCHTANLLGAARLLKAHEAQLEGKVRLMFQPAEETITGAKMMVDGGVCEGVDAAFGLHVFTNMPYPAGTVILTGQDGKYAAIDWFTINITGKGCHGAMPHKGVDPLNVMAHILIALQTLNSREMDPGDNMVLTIGQVHGGHTSNVIPETAMMSGTIRTLKNETRAMIKQRMQDIAGGIAASFGAQAVVEFGSGCPVLITNKEFYDEVKGFVQGLEGVSSVDLDALGMDTVNMASEDFAYISEVVPSAYLSIAAGDPAEGCCYPQHHPKAIFREEALPVGAATYAHVAMEWLKKHK